MNPDGSRRGHLRTNAAGANLNREWQSRAWSAARRSSSFARRWPRPGSISASTCMATRRSPTTSSSARREFLHSRPSRQALQRAYRGAAVARQPGLPDRAWLSRQRARQGEPHDVRQPRRRDLRLSLDDAGDAVQGQRRRAGCAHRLVPGALPRNSEGPTSTRCGACWATCVGICRLRPDCQRPKTSTPQIKRVADAAAPALDLRTCGVWRIVKPSLTA